MGQQRSTTRLPDYWTHLDGSPCLTPPDAPDYDAAMSGQLICEDHDRRVYPPDRTGEPLTKTVVSFDRIGRNHFVPIMDVDGDPTDLDAVAEQVYRYAGRFLGSRDYMVAVDEDGSVHIGGGRFGTGRIVRAQV